jgi:HAD superfamily hydrolase (TIGR01450 family)
VSLTPLIDGYDNLILDLDGTVWIGADPTPRAAEAIAALRAAGKRLMFVTNDGRRSPDEYVRKLWAIGCTAGVDEIVSVGSAIQFLLADRPPGRGVFVIGSPAIRRHVADAGHRVLNGTDAAEEAELVVVVAHDALTYGELETALRAVMSGAEMVCGGRDRHFPTPEGLAPGTGAIAAALEFASERTARNVGKPDREVFAAALDRLGEGRTLVIGDHLVSDLAGAAAAGLPAAVVLTGITSRAEAEAARDPAPVAIGESLAALVLAR